MKNNSSTHIMKYLEEAFPNKLPLVEHSPFEMGVLIGQQELINKLKIKLDIIKDKEMEDK